MKRTLPRSPRLNVDVTPQLIAEAVPRDSGHCMVADAVREAYPDARHISVDVQTIRFSLPDKGIRCTYLTPRTAQVALISFDQGTAPQPFRFTLRGGQVTKMRTHCPGPAPRSEAQRETTRKAQNASTIPPVSSAGRDRVKMVYGHGNGPSTGNIPAIDGGTPPPVGALASGGVPAARRRAFGLRAMDRVK